ncbi:MAG: SCP-like extracellular protein domain [Barrevirus sp.]|uniref:SCP-like extracellular protein domain n=1 Tax=Barrevirus sp. TaxID=2487763 RepID=A0A3G4ZQP4_9VIRU|nr:MAG: SCP-like extracellular protein domain [Barrevirus sp.]
MGNQKRNEAMTPLVTVPSLKNVWSDKQWLDAHNELRSQVGLSPLTWSTDLAKDAFEYANNGPTPDSYGNPSYPCDQGPGHSCKAATGSCLNKYSNYFCNSSNDSRFKNGDYQGENIGYACPYKSSNDATIMQQFIDEKKKYRYPTEPQESPGTGHYTQIVNQNVTKVGCGCSNCSDFGRLCVCRYDYLQRGDEVPY